MNNNDVVMIHLDRPRELRYGHKALKKLVALTGKSLEEIEQAGFDDFELVEKLVYCGLLKDAKEHGEQLELADMEELLDHAPSFRHIVECVSKAFSLTFSDPKIEGNQPAGESENENHSTLRKASA